MTQSTKHTPGPWKVSNNGAIDSHSGKTRIAKVYANGPVFGSCNLEDIANARLIAAAPDMLEALKETLPAFESCYLDEVDAGNKGVASLLFSILEKARAAIAKAEGE